MKTVIIIISILIFVSCETEKQGLQDGLEMPDKVKQEWAQQYRQEQAQKDYYDNILPRLGYSLTPNGYLIIYWDDEQVEKRYYGFEFPEEDTIIWSESTLIDSVIVIRFGE